MIEVEDNGTLGSNDVDDWFRRASQILVTHETKRRYPTGQDAIDADPVLPSLPVTRSEATPHVLLVGPFEGIGDLVAIALYVGIGLIEIRDVATDNANQTFGFRPIGGEGVHERSEFLLKAFGLYFDDVKITAGAGKGPVS